MNLSKSIVVFLISILFGACATQKSNTATVAVSALKTQNVEINSHVIPNQPIGIATSKTTLNTEPIEDTTFVNLKDFSNDFVYNMKYATTDNFLKSKVYECEACYLRYKTVKALVSANEKFMKRGYRIMLFDCYRPIDIQKKMWEIVSNPNYVADPKKGSIHNRGGAVDLSLVDSTGRELDMGTPFDFFGIEASHDYGNLSDEVKDNRKLLRKIMTRSDFKIFESEWWHYNLKNAKKEALSNFKWKCN